MNCRSDRCLWTIIRDDSRVNGVRPAHDRAWTREVDGEVGDGDGRTRESGLHTALIIDGVWICDRYGNRCVICDARVCTVRNCRNAEGDLYGVRLTGCEVEIITEYCRASPV